MRDKVLIKEFFNQIIFARAGVDAHRNTIYPTIHLLVDLHTFIKTYVFQQLNQLLLVQDNLANIVYKNHKLHVLLQQLNSIFVHLNAN